MVSAVLILPKALAEKSIHLNFKGARDSDSFLFHLNLRHHISAHVCPLIFLIQSPLLLLWVNTNNLIQSSPLVILNRVISVVSLLSCEILN